MHVRITVGGVTGKEGMKKTECLRGGRWSEEERKEGENVRERWR